MTRQMRQPRPMTADDWAASAAVADTEAAIAASIGWSGMAESLTAVADNLRRIAAECRPEAAADGLEDRPGCGDPGRLPESRTRQLRG